jgi:hypothetical protein
VEVPLFCVFNQVKAWEDTIVSRLTVTMAGTGPEYEYPTTGKDETIPVVSNEDPVSEGGQGTEPVVGEDYDVMDDKAIAGMVLSLLAIRVHLHL